MRAYTVPKVRSSYQIVLCWQYFSIVRLAQPNMSHICTHGHVKIWCHWHVTSLCWSNCRKIYMWIVQPTVNNIGWEKSHWKQSLNNHFIRQPTMDRIKDKSKDFSSMGKNELFELILHDVGGFGKFQVNSLTKFCVFSLVPQCIKFPYNMVSAAYISV